MRANPLEGVDGAGRQGDVFVDGVKTEFKTLDVGATHKTIKNVIDKSIEGEAQARTIVIDARGTKLSLDDARRGIFRGLGASRGKLDHVSVLGDDFFVGYGPR